MSACPERKDVYQDSMFVMVTMSVVIIQMKIHKSLTVVSEAQSFLYRMISWTIIWRLRTCLTQDFTAQDGATQLLQPKILQPMPLQPKTFATQAVTTQNFFNPKFYNPKFFNPSQYNPKLLQPKMLQPKQNCALIQW